MKSLKDALTLYRTLAAESLDGVDWLAIGARIGGALERTSDALSDRLHPGRPGQWQDLGFTTDLPSFAAMLEEKEAPLHERADQLRARIQPAWERMGALLGEPEKLEWTTPEIRTYETTADALAMMRETFAMPKVTLPKFADFKVSPEEIEPWQERVQDSVNAMVARIARAQDDMMRGTITETFIMGVDPESEWTRISRERVEKMATTPVGEDKVADWIVGIPIYVDPDDDTMLRMKTADIMAAPNGPKIIETVFGVSDPDGSVEDNPTT